VRTRPGTVEDTPSQRKQHFHIMIDAVTLTSSGSTQTAAAHAERTGRRSGLSRPSLSAVRLPQPSVSASGSAPESSAGAGAAALVTGEAPSARAKRSTTCRLTVARDGQGWPRAFVRT